MDRGQRQSLADPVVFFTSAMRPPQIASSRNIFFLRREPDLKLRRENPGCTSAEADVLYWQGTGDVCRPFGVFQPAGSHNVISNLMASSFP